MSQQVVTTAIVLARTDYGEADRIVTFLTPDHGKIRAMAKGVRRQKSKLAGGIELLSISEITVLPGRGELYRLLSSRLKVHYGSIVTDIDRTMAAYDALKRVNRITEDAAGGEYFALLQHSLAGLDDTALPQALVVFWLHMQLLLTTGHTPNLRTDTAGVALAGDAAYVFDHDAMGFRQAESGQFDARHIKLLRLATAVESPQVLGHIQNVGSIIPDVAALAELMVKYHLRV